MDHERMYIFHSQKDKLWCLFCSLDNQSVDYQKMPSMDDSNKNMLENLYADMDPSKMPGNNVNLTQPTGCDTR